MFENFLGMLRKRRRVDEQSSNASAQPPHNPNLTANRFWDSLFFANNSNETNCSSSQHNTTNTTATNTALQPCSKDSALLLDSDNFNASELSNVIIAAPDNRAQLQWSASDEAQSHLIAPPSPFHPHQPQQTSVQQHQQQQQLGSSNNSAHLYETVTSSPQQESSTKIQGEDMEIDSAPVPPPQEYSDCPSAYHSESSMNFDYLHGLHEGGGNAGGGVGASSSTNAANDAMLDSSSSSSYYNSPRHFSGVSGGAASSAADATSSSYGGQVDDSKALDRPFNLNERFVTVLDQLDARVEKFRKDALGLQEKRDFLLMSIDLIKSNDLMQNMAESEREEIICYIQRVNSRLSTVELNVRTVRDNSQEDSLSQINALIDMMITMGDPVLSRQRCQQYLNSCCSFGESATLPTFRESSTSSGGYDMDAGPVDKKFESALLGCTLDDQKNIKKRLQALMGYLNKQTIRE